MVLGLQIITIGMCMFKKSVVLLLINFLCLSSLFAEKVILEEDGKEGPLMEGLNFHHETWTYENGVMVGVQKSKKSHLATIRGKCDFNDVRLEWKMKFIEGGRFLFVTWAKGSRGHAMDFNLNPKSGDFAIIRPRSKGVKGGAVAKGKAPLKEDGWFDVVMEYTGKKVKLTINGTTIEGEDDAFDKEMEYFYLNGGFKYMVKDLKVTSLK
jgi:hypothetical protein